MSATSKFFVVLFQRRTAPANKALSCHFCATGNSPIAKECFYYAVRALLELYRTGKTEY